MNARSTPNADVLALALGQALRELLQGEATPSLFLTRITAELQAVFRSLPTDTKDLVGDIRLRAELAGILSRAPNDMACELEHRSGDGV